jgi:hypothetical protein
MGDVRPLEDALGHPMPADMSANLQEDGSPDGGQGRLIGAPLYGPGFSGLHSLGELR